ncbi:MAG: hypothetical protein JKY95_12985 [Planctomycetaceae bacterium]|nr:hypothetical protein [Planctomycetaceae bacterium]
MAALAVLILSGGSVSYYVINGEMKRATAAEGIAVKAEGEAKPIVEFLEHEGPVVAMDVSPDETKLLSVVNRGDQEQSSETAQTVIYLWGRQTGKILGKMSGHTAAVTSVAYSEDGVRRRAIGEMKS